MIPENVTVIQIPTSRIVDWQSVIKLNSDALALLEEIAGPTPDARFFSKPEDVDFDTESWGWSINWNSYRDAPSRTVSLWFKDPRHAVYFKTLWGGT